MTNDTPNVIQTNQTTLSLAPCDVKSLHQALLTAQSHLIDNEAAEYIEQGLATEELQHITNQSNTPTNLTIMSGLIIEKALIIAADLLHDTNNYDEIEKARSIIDHAITDYQTSQPSILVLPDTYIGEVLSIELEDNEDETGGISYAGETVGDFINTPDVDLGPEDYVSELNKVLKECGIKPLC